MATRTRLTTDQKLRALALLARGDTLSQVAAQLLTDFNVKVTESALSQLRRAHQETLDKMRDAMVEAESASAEALLKRTHRMIGARLDRADRDGKELEELDRSWREGEIKDYEVYRRRKAGLMKISINELTTVSRTMHTQTVKMPALPPGDPDRGPAVLPSGHHSNPAELEALLESIKHGNTVEMQRLIFNPGAAS